MKYLISLIFILLTGGHLIFAQTYQKDSKNFRFFNRTELFYSFGLNDTYPGDKINALHIKTILGTANEKIGFGFGVENSSFRSANGFNGSSFNTIAFSGNVHYLVKPISDDGINFFVKGSLGYAPRIFYGYDRGLNMEAATGLMITNKRKRKYFLEGLYNYQQFDQFNSNNKPEVKSIGLGIGSWF
jgi:hypothetical protein